MALISTARRPKNTQSTDHVSEWSGVKNIKATESKRLLLRAGYPTETNWLTDTLLQPAHGVSRCVTESYT